jgi:NAD(P)-dependent dehydrogenase (short-subunit alcohol dehydrogenase family)
MSSSKAVILVTGGNQRIGFATAQLLAITGKYRILLGSRSISKAEAAIQQLLSSPGYPIEKSSITPITIDVTSEEYITSAAKYVKGTCGSLR